MSKDIHLSNEEYQNLMKLFNGENSYSLIYSEEEQCFLLFVHGSKTGYIIMNNSCITLTEIGQILDHLNYNICIKVICCYGAYQTSYKTCNVSVKPYIDNKDVMYFKPFIQNGENYCNIYCSV